MSILALRARNSWLRDSLPVAATAALLAGCGPAPVGRVTVSPAAFTLAAGAYAPLTIELQPAMALPASTEPFVFVHLVADDGALVRTFDHPLPADWRPDQRIAYRVEIYQSTLGPALAAGTYRLTLGLLSGTTRLPLATAGRTRGRLEYEVATVTVPTASTSAGTFAFAEPTARGPVWAPVEAGDARQVVARRWLLSPGGVTVTAPAAGNILLSLVIPVAKAGESHFELAAGNREPGLTVRTACGDHVTTLTGAGPHRAEIPVPAGGCELLFEPDYALVEEPSGTRRVAVVEALAWGAAGP